MPSFHFKGKTFLQNYHHTVKFHKLDPKKDKGTTKTTSLDDNLVIHGDNLKALKALLPTHAGKIKCIYIDPPYNTGNENWIYNDNVASPMIQTWLGKEVNIDDLARHDKWCCMMYPRLTLLRELLSDDGVIFASIDENESHHMRLLMDEIFGSENFLTQISWRSKKQISSDNKGFSSKVEYILVYSKSEQFTPNKLPLSEEYKTKSFSNPNNDPKGTWQSVAITASKGHQGGGYDYEITTPSEKKIERKWLYPKKSYEKLKKDNRLWFGAKGESVPRRIIYLDEIEGQVPDNLWLEMGTNRDGKLETTTIFDKTVFDTPKPVKLIKTLLRIATDKDDLILDSFAGSGTTGHAVLALNQEDGGNRKFIMVECEDYADKITAERMRRVIKGVPSSKDTALQKGLKGTFSYYKLGEELEMDKVLEGKDLPDYEELARYAFFTATGENWGKSKADKSKYYIGSSNTFEIFLLYEPDKKKLKNLALNLDFATQIQNQFPNRQKLVFAPACFMEEHHLKEYGIRFAQLPFEIYRMAE